MWLPVDVVDGVEIILEPPIHPDFVALPLVGLVVRQQGLIHLHLLVDISEFVLATGFLPALAALLRFTDNRPPVRLFVLSIYGVVVVLSVEVSDCLLASTSH